jgi:hypothetical protein
MVSVELLESELVRSNNRVARRALERIGLRDGLGPLETFCVLQRPNPGDGASVPFHVVGYELSGQPTVDEAFSLLLREELERAQELLEGHRLIMVALFDGVDVRWIPVPVAAIGLHFQVIQPGVRPVTAASRSSLLN